MAMTIKQKQWQLYFLGYYGGSIDGIWGSKSIKATRDLQDQSGIKVDGIFGPSTEDKSREIVDAIQDVLNEYVSPKLVNDGLAGPKTMEATKRYQKAKSLPQTGRIDGDTWDALMEESLYDDAPSDAAGGTNAPATGTSSSSTAKKWVGKYFTREELKCKCDGRYCNGFPAEPQELLVILADRARKHFGAPAYNVSCLRCYQHNINSGGVVNSRHRFGKAMDIRIHGVSADALLAFFKKQPEVRYCYKINSTNVHFDIA